MNRKKLNEQVVKLFGPEIHNGLKNFVSKIDSYNADIIILLARKALCLFKLLDTIGIKRPNSEIVSDRILDLNPEYFTNKKVLVVDDTLILGSTLKNIKERLVKANANVQIYVFCVDQDNWHKKLIIPNYVEKFYPADIVLNFCNTLVQAFTMVAQPYLVDFPITSLISIDKEQFGKFLKKPELKVIRLNSDYYHVDSYTILLPKELKEKFYQSVGCAFKKLIEVLKIRTYAMLTERENARVRFVPIVLLRDIHADIINCVFEHIIKESSEYDKIIRLLKSEEIKLRFIQYYLSARLGRVFMKEYCNYIGEVRNPYKYSELINIFGCDVAQIYDKLLKQEIPPIKKIAHFKSQANKQNIEDIYEGISVKEYHILQSFQEIFVNLVEKRELPARKEYQESNLKIAKTDRLLNGISFNNITLFICKKLSIQATEEVKEILSVCLDLCNDQGISVPIICKSNNYLYRAFRHGELGKNSKGNVLLLYNYLQTFFKENGYEPQNGIDKVLLEKLAVLFYRVSAKTRNIEVTDNYNDPLAVNIGFHLYGAVLIKNKEKEYFPQESGDWFLTHSCYQLFQEKDGKYFYHKIPQREGTPITDKQILEAKRLGRLIGTVTKLQSDRTLREKGEEPLNLKRLALLVSCYSLGDIIMALAAELNICYNWILDTQSVNFSNGSNIERYFDKFSDKIVYKAYNQAIYKFENSFSKNNNVDKIINNVSSYIQRMIDEGEKDEILLSEWKYYIKQFKIGQEDRFKWLNLNPRSESCILVLKIFTQIVSIGINLIYLRFLSELRSTLINPSIKINSSFKLKLINLGRIEERKLVKKKHSEISKGEVGYRTIPGRSFANKKINEKGQFQLKNQSYNYEIIAIDNKNIIYDSEIALDNYQTKIMNIEVQHKVLAESKHLNKIKKEFNETKKKVDIYKKMSICSLDKITSEVTKVITQLSNQTYTIEILLKQAKEIYGKSRENYTTLLSN